MADRTVSVRIKVTGLDAFAKDASQATGATRILRREAERLDGTHVRATAEVRGVDRSTRQVRGLRRELRGLHLDAHSLKIPAIATAGVAAAPWAASAIASAKQLTGVLALLPALATSAAAGVGVLAVGVSGFADGVSRGGEALDELAPSARRAAAELRSQSAAWRDVQRSIQGALFRGQAERLDEFGRRYLPVAERAAGALATELGNAAGQFIDFVNTAESVRDTSNGLEHTAEAAKRLGPTIVNLTRIWRDMSAVGARELPELALHFELMTRRWSDAIQRARYSGDLQRWMREGQAEAAQLGNVLRHTGGLMAGLGRGAELAGVDVIGSLERMTERAHAWSDSWQGQAAIRETLRGIRSDVDAFIPGLRDLAGMALDFVQNLSGSGTLRAAGDAFSALTESARPTVEVLGTLTGTVLRPLLATLQAVAPLVGPIAAGMIAWRGASAAISGVRGGLDGLAGRFDRAAASASGGAKQTSRVGGALRGVGGYLPVLGLGLLAAAGGYELLRDRSEEAAQGVANGSLTFAEAVEKQRSALERQQTVMDAMIESQPGYATGVALSGEAHDKAAEAARLDAQALADVVREYDAMIAKAPPLEAASLTVTKAQALHNDAIAKFGPNSLQAQQAASNLTAANKALELQQYANSLGVDTHTAALIRNRDTMMASKDAEFAFAQAKLQAKESIAQNGATLDWNTEQGIRNQSALNGMRDAALRDIEAKKEHGLTVGEATSLAKGHEDQLYRTAREMGMSEEAARKYVDELALVPRVIETRVRLIHDRVNARTPSANMAEHWPARATGGPIHGPGSGTSDSIPALLSDGEWVIKAATVADLGDAKMRALNEGRADIVPRFAAGGRVGRAAGSSVPRYASGGAVSGGGGMGGLDGALADLRAFRAELGRIWAGVGTDTERHWSTVESTVSSRMAAALFAGTTGATGLRTGVAGQFGQLPGVTDRSFGQVQGTVGTRMAQTGVTAIGEAGALHRNVAGSWSGLYADSDRRFADTQTAIGGRMVATRDHASRTAGELDRNVSGSWVSLLGSSVATWSATSDNARRKWDELRGHVDSPVRWVINTAWNTGARALWDAAGKIFPLGGFPAAKYAIGGPVHGPGTGTSDSIPAMLSSGEHVWTAREVQATGGHAEVARLRQLAGAGQLATFAQGGAWQQMWGTVRQQFPAARLTSGYRPGDPGYHGRGQAVDIAGPRSMDMPFMLAVNRWLASRFPGSAELIHTPGINLKNGRPHTYNAGTRAQHYNHVHWAQGGLSSAAGGGVIAYAADMLAEALAGPKDALRKMAPPRNGTLSGDLPANSVDWIIKQAEDVLRAEARKMDDAMMAGMSGGGGGRAGAERWRPLVLQALRMLGHPASLADRVLMQIGTESGGDPRAINRWDSNAKRGTPSMGLLQTIQPTYNAYADPRRNLGPYDPLSNILASMRYALARYGSLTAAYRGVGYDTGGVIPGHGEKFVLAHGGERILTQGQSRTFDRLVDVLDRPTPVTGIAGAVRGGDGEAMRPVVNIHNENHFAEVLDIDIFNSRQDFAIRSAAF
ncbi:MULTISPECIES: lytic transglycosylase domain-containing protein [Pseudonocardia]|uniref:Transglycosylase SLT domain protein n=2 Tax=Pseudonocardia TaxID=1847 RepID=A0A1Y2N8R4_PSEAH|nr:MULTISPECIES: hypothetical protein [Pseudonocardia]OSY43559.1 Transglycosylase SLT domain protein [Pseudonocardia autotrophica]TDN73450.1 hypothetical protein C8E95_2547 [Pseudonocardia autotrophica]BBG04190.1 hypothetical protein Pdca_53990 [Pseudonocardia autotrophica]GEC25521.1 hypothetical protein PSA01_25500 [Pseudonocardia saturnea]